MKILVLCPFYPPHIGGVENYCDELNRQLSGRGTAITVFTPHLPADTPETESRGQGFRILRFPAVELIHNYPFPAFWKTRFWQLWSSLPDGRHDLVISHTRFFFTSLMAWRYARRNGIPWAHIEHGSDFAHFGSRWKSRLARLYDRVFGRFALRSSDLNIAISEASRLFAEQLSGRSGCEMIYRGVAAERIARVEPDPDPRRRFPGKTIVGYVGRLSDGKGVPDLVAAFAALGGDGCALVIVGEGPERPRLERMVRTLGIEDHAHFAGHLPPHAALACMTACDIVVNPSYTEGLPSSVIEAALLGKAILATDVGGTREIVDGRGDGFLVAPGDRAALTAGLLVLVADSDLRHRLGQSALGKTRGRFDWKSAIDRYQMSFDALVQRGSGSALRARSGKDIDA